MGKNRSKVRENAGSLVDLVEAARILERSVYRVRQCVWSGEFARIVRKDRKIYLDRAEVESIRQKRDERARRAVDLTEKRRIGRKVRAIAAIREEFAKNGVLRDLTLSNGQKVAEYVNNWLDEREKALNDELNALNG